MHPTCCKISCLWTQRQAKSGRRSVCCSQMQTSSGRMLALTMLQRARWLQTASCQTLGSSQLFHQTGWAWMSQTPLKPGQTCCQMPAQTPGQRLAWRLGRMPACWPSESGTAQKKLLVPLYEDLLQVWSDCRGNGHCSKRTQVINGPGFFTGDHSQVLQVPVRMRAWPQRERPVVRQMQAKPVQRRHPLLHSGSPSHQPARSVASLRIWRNG